MEHVQLRPSVFVQMYLLLGNLSVRAVKPTTTCLFPQPVPLPEPPFSSCPWAFLLPHGKHLAAPDKRSGSTLNQKSVRAADPSHHEGHRPHTACRFNWGSGSRYSSGAVWLCVRTECVLTGVTVRRRRGRGGGCCRREEERGWRAGQEIWKDNVDRFYFIKEHVV